MAVTDPTTIGSPVWQGRRPRSRRADIDWSDPFSRLALCHVGSVSGEALLAISLAGSLFFKVDPASGREKVLLGLLLTMAPFALVGPLIGPLIDKVPGGHRAVIILTLGVRTAIAAAMTVAAAGHSLVLFPEAFFMLVLGKTYQIAKAALVPATVDGDDALVEANSHLQVLSGLAGLAAGLPGALLAWIGPEWALALTAIVFGVTTVLAFGLTRDVDDWAEEDEEEEEDEDEDEEEFEEEEEEAEEEEEDADEEEEEEEGEAEKGGDEEEEGEEEEQRWEDEKWEEKVIEEDDYEAERRRLATAELRSGAVMTAATSMAILRGMVGLVSFALAFALRGESNRAAAPPTWYFAAVILVSVFGGLVGASIAPRLRRAFPEERILLGATSLAVVVGLSALAITGLPRDLLLAGGVAIAATAGKQAFDALVQRDAPDADRGRLFARFESGFQIVWVIGALLPTAIHLAVSVAAVMVMIAGVVATVLYAGGMRRIAAELQVP